MQLSGKWPSSDVPTSPAPGLPGHCTELSSCPSALSMHSNALVTKTLNSRRHIESFPVMDLGGQPGMGKAACNIASFIGQMQPAQRPQELGRSGEGASYLGGYMAKKYPCPIPVGSGQWYQPRAIMRGRGPHAITSPGFSGDRKADLAVKICPCADAEKFLEQSRQEPNGLW